MFVGHFAAAFVAKKYTPKTSLATLFVACQLLDLIWPVLMFLGIETAGHNHSLPTFNSLDLISVPYSHGLIMSILWSLLFGIFVKKTTQSSRAALVCSIVVFSHWILDFITHIPDLPIWLSGPKLGLGMWKSAILTFCFEGSLFITGIAIYLKTNPLINRKKKIIFYSLVTFLSAVYILSVFGPPPPESTSPNIVAGPAFALWILVLWAYFVEKKPN